MDNRPQLRKAGAEGEELMREELKPCPFCGGEPKAPEQKGGSDERFGYNFHMVIECECGIKLSRQSKEGKGGWCADQGEARKAVTEAWNRRIYADTDGYGMGHRRPQPPKEGE